MTSLNDYMIDAIIDNFEINLSKVDQDYQLLPGNLEQHTEDYHDAARDDINDYIDDEDNTKLNIEYIAKKIRDEHRRLIALGYTQF